MPSLAVEGAVAFLLLLAPERQHAVRERDIDVLLLDPGQLGHDLDVLLALAHLDIGPAGRPAEARWHRQIEAPKEVVEKPVHLAMQREERAGFLGVARFRPHGIRLLTSMVHLHCKRRRMRTLALRTQERARRAVQVSDLPEPRAQAACRPSSVWGSLLLAIAIRRGFIASGTSRTRSIMSRPCSSFAPTTFT